MSKLSWQIYVFADKSPRILIGQHISHVTILESPDAHGYFSFRDVIIRTKENSDDGSDVRFVMVTIKRTGKNGKVEIFFIYPN